MSPRQAPLRQALADYLSLRRALGVELSTAGRLLHQYLGWLDEHGMDTITIDNALAWATLPDGAAPAWWAIRLGAVRGFAAHLHSIDPGIEVPPATVIRRGPDRATPYIYTDAEVSALIAAAGELKPRLRAATYQTLISLLVITGCRIGELIALDTGDVDTGRNLLMVRDAKAGSSRLVPLEATAMAALARYADLRDQAHPYPASPALLLSARGTRLLHSNIGFTYARLLKRAGITRRSAACRPRIHDHRHSFAVNTLRDWYARGADVPAMMPRLSTYLGHSDPKHTFWYLSAAPELMALAGQRLDAYLRGRS